MGLGEFFRAKTKGKEGWLTGQTLIATPSMPDPRFARTVIFLCSHGPEGAMGLVVNRLFGEITFRGLLKQLDITMASDLHDVPVHFGGPVETGRGFVLHSASFRRDGTMPINDLVSLTATVEILEALAHGNGPDHALLALGYAGWGPGQLETEIQDNGWLIAPADEEILFMSATESKWDRALAKMGVSPTALSGDVGHA